MWRRPGVVVGILLTVAAGCGGGGSTHPSDTRAATQGQGKVAYAACMRGHGVPMNGPDGNGDFSFSGMLTRAGFQSGQSACQSVWPPSSGWDLDRLLQLQDYRMRLRACLAQQGVDLRNSPNVWDIPLGPGARGAFQTCLGTVGPSPTLGIQQPDAASRG